MVSIYVVDTNPPSGEESQIHTTWCKRAPALEDQLFLGHFENCHDALRRAHALDLYPNGCYFCSKECYKK